MRDKSQAKISSVGHASGLSTSVQMFSLRKTARYRGRGADDKGEVYIPPRFRKSFAETDKPNNASSQGVSMKVLMQA